jgi:tyrosyl-tRNA synthetase
VCSSDLLKSKNEIKRLIEQKAVKIGGIVVGSINEEVKERPVVVSCGRKKFSITNPR